MRWTRIDKGKLCFSWLYSEHQTLRLNLVVHRASGRRLSIGGGLKKLSSSVRPASDKPVRRSTISKNPGLSLLNPPMLLLHRRGDLAEARGAGC